MKTSRIVEAVLFASDAPLKAGEIARADDSLDEDRVEAAIQELRTEYDEEDRSFHVAELGEGYQILTRSEFSTYLERFDTVPQSSRLSGPALETLAIVAYRQPISRVEVEYIRGVSSSGVLRTLQDRSLIEVVGRGEGVGRPYLYGTTQEFLNHFGFRSLEELPRREELPVVLRDPQPLEDEMEKDDEADAGEPVEVDEADVVDEGPSVDEAVSRVLESEPEDAGAKAGEAGAESEEAGAEPAEPGEPAEAEIDPEVEPEEEDRRHG